MRPANPELTAMNTAIAKPTFVRRFALGFVCTSKTLSPLWAKFTPDRIRAVRVSEERRTPIIAVDAMGGDDAPAAVVEGAAEASLQAKCEIVLVGDEPVITKLLGG